MLEDATRVNNCDPTPPASGFGGLPSPQGAHKGEGRLGREPSCKATERVARAVSTSTG